MPEPRLDLDHDVATITLADPGGVNGLDAEHVARLRTLVTAADADPDVAVIVLRAEARAFCAGGDIAWFAAQAETLHEDILGLADDAAQLIRLLHETPKLTIAAVHGAVAGGGLGVALACDVVVAAEDTTFAVAYNRIGASPDLGVSAFLVRDVGYRRALELCLLAERLDAADALRLGLITRVVAAEALDETAQAIARRLADGPREANTTTKRLLRTASRQVLADHLGDELRSVADLSRTADWQEGIRAFLDGRAPRFAGARPRSAAG